MSTSEEGWANPHTAERYAEFAVSHEMYRRTSADLVDRAAIADDATVVDLCAGTGITTEAVLGKLSAAGRVFAVDGSEAMLEHAQRRLDDDRARWIHGQAEQVDQLVAEPVDAVVCNSAIWQTDIPATFSAVRKALRPGGTFSCNIGRGFLIMPFTAQESARTTPSLMELMSAFAAIELNYSAPLGARRGGRPLTLESVTAALSTAGLTPSAPHTVSYSQTPDEEVAWLRIPIFTERHFPGLDYPTRMRLLDKAHAHAPRTESQASTWVIFSAVA